MELCKLSKAKRLEPHYKMHPTAPLAPGLEAAAAWREHHDRNLKGSLKKEFQTNFTLFNNADGMQ